MLINSLRDIYLDQSKFPIFFGDEWLGIQRKSANTFIYYDDKNFALIPFKTQKIKFLIKSNYLYIPLDLNGKEFDSKTEKIIIEKFHIYMSKLCDIILPPQHIVNFKSIPSNVIYFKLGIIYIDLTKEIDELLKRMSKSYSSKLRQAEKNSVQINFELSDIDEFYRIYNQTHKKQNMTAESLNYFSQFIDEIPQNIIVGKSVYLNETESSIFCLKDFETCYYEYGGTSDKTKFAGSNKLLFLKLFDNLKKQNCRKLVLGGYRENAIEKSKLSGIQTFKFRLGGELHDGYHFIKINNSFKYNLFNLMLKIKSMITGRKLELINLIGLEIKKS